MEKIQYIRKNGRAKGRKKGVLIAVPAHSRVFIGFSLMHPSDKFDYVGAVRTKDFGLRLAKKRAFKYKDAKGYCIQKTYTENEISKFVEGEMELRSVKGRSNETVVIPPSVMRDLKPFIERCRLYYKDKIFPAWVVAVENGTPDVDVVFKNI